MRMHYCCLIADYHNPDHASAIRSLMQHYARDPMGGGKALAETTLEQLPQRLAQVAGAFTILCYQQKEVVGLINVLQGFSTFQCKPLLNLHDVVVLESHRRCGVSQLMLQQVEAVAMERDCCKITLEVLEGNTAAAAAAAYRHFGFAPYQLDPTMGSALFFEKQLITQK